MNAPVEVRRFLHCNYNCNDVGVLERWYQPLFDLKPVMRTTSSGMDGTPFGIYGPTASDTLFLYDHRGGRGSNSLELVQWTQPVTYGSPYPAPWYRGMQSVAFQVADIDAVAAKAVELGGSLVRRGADWLLLKDPEGVNVEVIHGDGPTLFRYIRIVVSDMARTMGWWQRLGFTESHDLAYVPGAEAYPAADGHAVVAERAIVATDDPTFALIFTSWSGPVPTGPTYAMPYHHALYRMAMAVDDVKASTDALDALGIPRQPYYTFELPGTKLTDGLTILFIRDPDGILVELVDRPRKLFAK
jgi:catechol 2,3-dioxygenase-like lactoylglutathione lyase family enzyme